MYSTTKKCFDVSVRREPPSACSLRLFFHPPLSSFVRLSHKYHFDVPRRKIISTHLSSSPRLSHLFASHGVHCTTHANNHLRTDGGSLLRPPSTIRNPLLQKKKRSKLSQIFVSLAKTPTPTLFTTCFCGFSFPKQASS